MHEKLIFFSIVLSNLFWIPSAVAGKVYKVKDKDVYIKLSSKEQSNLIEGDTIYLLNEDKKKKGIAIIKKIKGKKAKAELTKGKVEKGFATKSKSPGNMKKLDYEDAMDGNSYEKDAAKSDSSSDSGPKFLLLGGYSVAGQDVLQEGAVTQTTTTKGTSMSVRGMIDYPVFSGLSALGGIGFEKFGVTGDGIDVTDGSPIAAQTDISYLSLDFWGRLDLIDFGAKLYVLAGGGLYLPMSKSSNILAAESITTTGLFLVGGGLRIPMGGMDIMIGGDYYIFQPSDSVKSSLMGVKIGLSFGL